MVSITLFSLKAVSLEMAPAVGREGGTYIPRIRKRWGVSDCSDSAPGSTRVTSSHDLFQHSKREGLAR